MMNRERFHIQTAKFLDAHLGRLLVRALGVLRQDAKGADLKPEKILFIKFWGIGSIILSEPALRSLRRSFPEAEIHYLTLRQNRQLFEMIPGLSRVHWLDFRSPWGFLWESLLLLRKLRRERYDLIIDAEFFAHFSALLAVLAGGKRLAGFAQPRGAKQKLLDVAVPFSKASHASRQFLRLVEAAGGVSRQDAKAQRKSKDAMAWPQLKLSGTGLRSPFSVLRSYIVLNINASPLAVERRWPRERFAQLGRELLRRYGFDLVLVGAASEVEYVRPLEENLNEPARVRNLAGKLSLRRLAEVIQGSLLLISNDSGPLHMAAALGVPVVGLYGPETPLRYGPLAVRRRIFYRGLWCSPCMSLDNAKTVNCINGLACMREIGVEEVVAGVVEFLEREVLVKEAVLG
ncbi:MAG: glycosyltransferase family 9 protein [Acidobacteriota bacterium]